MSDLKKWLETVSTESAEHSADIEAQTELKDDEATATLGDNEKLTDDASQTDAEVKVEVEGSDTAVSVEDEEPETEVDATETVTASSVSDDHQAALHEPVDINQPIETEVALEDGEAESDEVENTEGEEGTEAAVDEVVDEVEETTEEVVEEVLEEEETVETDEEPILEVDPVAEIQDDVESTPVEGEDEAEVDDVAEEEDESFEDFDSIADDGITADMDGVDQDIDDMGNLQTALEAYSELLSNEMERNSGVIEPALVRAVQIGLESFNEPIILQDIPSLEDFTDPTGRYAVSLEFAEGLKDKAGKVAKATMAAIQRLWELLEDIFRQFKANVPALKQKNEELAEKLKNTVDAGKGTVSMKGARRLYIGDMFAGNNPNNIRTVYQVGDKFMVLYPKQFKAITEEYKRLTQSLLTDGDGSQSITALTIAVTKHFNPGDLGLQQINPSKAPSDMQKYTGIAASPVLLGNRRFFAGVNDVKIEADRSGNAITSDSATNAIVYMADYFKLIFGTEAGVPDSGTDDVVKLPDVATLQQLTTETATLTKHLETYTEATGNFRQIRREMQQTIAKLHGIDKYDSYGQVNKLAFIAQGITRAITVPTGHFVGYVGNLVRILQAFIEYCINEHRAAVTDV